jgi:hypothetical protein
MIGLQQAVASRLDPLCETREAPPGRHLTPSLAELAIGCRSCDLSRHR